MNAIVAITFIPLFIFFIFTPYVTRKTEIFGVSIPEKIYGSTELKQLRKQYVIATTIVSMIVFLILFFSPTSMMEEKKVGIFLPTVIIGYIIIEFFIYLYFHRIMKLKKQTADWTKEKTEKILIHTKFRNQQLRFSHKWFIIPFIISMVTTTLSYFWYDQFPAQLPINFDFLGEATNFVSKSYLSILALPLAQFFLTGLFFAINVLIGNVKQQISAENPNKSLQQNVIFRKRWSSYMVISSILLTLWLSIAQFILLIPKGQPLFTIGSITIHSFLLLGVIYLAFSTGQGGSRVKFPDERNEQVIDRDNDKYWKLGQFYVNKNDPALFLEKRFGIGWTINLGKPLSWIIILITLLVVLGLILLTR
ncbi:MULTISPECIES: DUF5808 domain-containing protein [Clostridia]|uniref:DUF1648 domain-containing protein n=1 Tax=Clostridia TaxID=186801 RepID=UPI000EA0C142|nr:MULTISPECIES: DUF5808 domain-containing protein [Clostridia]NBJ70121.1 DUF1648 domain-containing protein [Roseburia sp. 1XD42-34]RKI77078.1 DUF1648 domain-containing protein [Clostridium sp. 1xD42-85]